MTASPEVETVVYQRADDVLSRRAGDSVLILVRRSGSLVQISGSGVALWDTLAIPRSANASAKLLADSYGVDAGTVQRDIDPVLDDLVSRGAVLRLGQSR